MTNPNYFKLQNFPFIQLVGFPCVDKTAYIRISYLKQTFVVNANKMEEKANCYRIDITDDRTICSERLYQFLRHHKLDNVHFVYNQFMNNYFASDIKI